MNLFSKKLLTITLIGFFLDFFFGLFLISSSRAVELPDFTELAEKYSPSVVNILSEKEYKEDDKKENEKRDNSPFFFDDPFRDFFERRPNPKNKRPQRSGGSGFIISKDGYIVTNNHVVEGATTVKVTLTNDETFVAEVVGLDSRMDLALLKIDAKKDLPFITFGDSKSSKVGEWVIAIGNPLGLGGSVTAGIISAVGRDIRSGPYDSFIQTDAPINKGNSGGPLINLNGEVIGVNTMIFSQTGGSIGIGFSIPSDLAEPVINQLKEFGETRRGWLGVVIQDVTEEVAKDMDLKEEKGALVQDVVKGGPADKAGIETGDVIIKFGKTDINKMRDLTTNVANTEIGKKVKVELIRLGKKKTLSVKLGRLEGNEESLITGQTESKSKKIMGIGFVELTPEIRRRESIPSNIIGVAVVDVDEDSEAYSKKITDGSVLMSITYQKVSGNLTYQSTVKVTSPDQAYKLLNERKEAGDERILLRVWRPEYRVSSLVALSFDDKSN